MKKLILLKLGGSLITDKTKPYTAKQDIIANLASQVREVFDRDRDLQLIIGNGGGSFPHYPAVTYHMKDGIHDEKQKMGFCMVQDAAARLNRIVVAELLAHDIRACTVSPSSISTSENGEIKTLSLESILGFLRLGITPVIYGDIVADSVVGSKIFSTEQLLSELAKRFSSHNIKVAKIIHNGVTKGVLDENGRVIPLITKNNFGRLRHMFYSTEGYDVTGGMIHKVEESLELTDLGIETLIINGSHQKTILRDALLGKKIEGTVIKA